MNIERFFAKNSREALSLVKKELGEDAVILSNRAVDGGNEILAFREADIESMISDEPYSEPSKKPIRHRLEDFDETAAEPTFLSYVNKNHRDYRGEVASSGFSKHNEREFDRSEADQSAHIRNLPPKVFTQRRSAEKLSIDPAMLEPINRPAQKTIFKTSTAKPAVVTQTTPAPQVIETTAANNADREASEQQIANMMSEIRIMRNAIESQLTEMSWGNIQKRDPVKAMMLSTLLTGGFSPALSRQLAEKMPANLTQKEAMSWTQAIIDKNLMTMPDETDILDKGGIFTLIGPTGVGKTTTTAKLAARFVMKHGASKLGLITTDAYRIGGHEQLRIYGKILGVMVHAVKDEADLQIALEELKGKHTILIDTVGVSQRDRMVSEQIAMLSNTNRKIKKLLCLNATNTSETLTDVINAYKGKGLDGCIITKLDEAAIIGNVLDVTIREKLKVYYVANGQRVPEDLHLANKKVLVHRALKLGTQNNSPYKLANAEIPFVMGATRNKPGVSHLVEADHA